MEHENGLKGHLRSFFSISKLGQKADCFNMDVEAYGYRVHRDGKCFEFTFNYEM